MKSMALPFASPSVALPSTAAFGASRHRGLSHEIESGITMIALYLGALTMLIPLGIGLILVSWK